jgi:murein L,D-transpeptidase YcbB/YkuD
MRVLRAIVFTLSLLSAWPLAAQTATEALRLRVEQLHEGGVTTIRGGRLLQRDAVAHFFQQRGFEPPWRIPAHSDQIRRAILAIEQDGLTPADYHLAAIDALLARGATRTAADEADLQVLLTDAVAALVDHVRYGKVRPSSLDRRWNVDPRDGAPPLESEVARIAGSSSIDGAIAARAHDHFIYRGLKQALASLRAIDAKGGWPVVTAGPSLKPGASDARVAQVRARLLVSGDLPSGSPATETTYDAALEAVVRRFQERHRLTADGAIGRATVDAMNVSARTRIQQVRANLERARWVLGGLQDTFLLVNLPAFKVYFIRGGTNVWESRTQIGRAARQTPTFRADMRYLVFNPDWTVPPTILAKDVLAGMKQGKNTIGQKGLAILDRQGRAVDPAAIDWQSATPATFPYTLRQPPGPDNALGRVKFIFPNEHAIFLHDTPSRELFATDLRTFSSGCIRVERPLELAARLLERQEDWTPEKISQVVGAGASETVLLEQPLPVLIVYWTVSVGASGELRFARDVYGRDAPLIRALGGARRD